MGLVCRDKHGQREVNFRAEFPRGPAPHQRRINFERQPGQIVLFAIRNDLSGFRFELTTVVVGSRSALCPSSRRVALWLLLSSERISVAVRA